MLDRTSHISRCISWLQFPLAILVILMHTDVTYDHSDPSSVLNAFLCWPIPAAALPAFFFISGYLFFAERDTFIWKDYRQAMYKKFFTLLLPYLLWISIAYLSSLLIHGLDYAPEPTDIRGIFWDGRPILPEHSLFGYTFHMFGMPGGFGVMWFVRDLMVMMLFTPFIWMIGKTLGKLAIFLILIAIITHSRPVVFYTRLSLRHMQYRFHAGTQTFRAAHHCFMAHYVSCIRMDGLVFRS